MPVSETLSMKEQAEAALKLWLDPEHENLSDAYVGIQLAQALKRIVEEPKFCVVSVYAPVNYKPDGLSRIVHSYGTYSTRREANNAKARLVTRSKKYVDTRNPMHDPRFEPDALSFHAIELGDPHMVKERDSGETEWTITAQSKDVL